MKPLLLLACALAPSLQPSADVLTPESVARIRAVSTALIAPDASAIAWVLAVPREAGVEEDGGAWSELWLADFEGGTPRRFVGPKSEFSALEWTPDGRALAFLARRGDDKSNSLYLLARDGGEARRAARLEGGISGFSLAPDGKRVALLGAGAPPAARKKEQDKGFKEEVYEEDWRPARVWIANLFEEGSAKPLELEGSAFSMHWNPLDDRLAVALAPTPLVDDEYMSQRIHVVDAASGKVLAKIDNPGKLGDYGWSPDGNWIALLSAADIHDPYPARLCLAPATGGVPTEIAPGFEGDVTAFDWQGDVASILCCIDQGTQSGFVRLEVLRDGQIVPDGARKQILPPGEPVLTSVSISHDGQHGVFVASAPAHPPEVFRMSHGDGAPVRVSDSNPWLKEVELGKQEIFRHKSRDGLELEGLLVHPLHEVAGQHYPLILCVHGGPESHEVNGWQTGYSKPGQMAAAAGFAVFYPNYRGSTGRGVAFAKLSQGDAAGKEFDDLVDAVDALVATGLVDKERVGITGGSYGGYATAWCSTRYSERFAAGVMFVGISDKISKVGTTDIPNEEFYVHALHRVWDDWKFYLERSPIYWAEKCKTPLLILHGKDDPRVNPGQSRELYRQLKVRNQTPVRLVLYPGEGHGNRKACARLDYCERMMQWFETYLKGDKKLPGWGIEHAAQSPKGQ
jgi:dipeptidyl aminopeptidase/acylaminoacyl peptidase